MYHVQAITFCDDNTGNALELDGQHVGTEGIVFRNSHGDLATYHVGRISPDVMQYLWGGGRLREEISEDRRLWGRTHSAAAWHRSLGRDHRSGVRKFFGYACVDDRHKYALPSKRELSPEDDGSDVDLGQRGRYMHIQPNRDFAYIQAAPKRIGAFFSALRAKNAAMLDDLVCALDGDSASNTLSAALAEVIRAGGVFGAVSVHQDAPHEVTKRSNEYDRLHNRHWDAVTSLLHGALTIRGRRKLAVWGTPLGTDADTLSGAHMEFLQEEGHFYLGNAANYAHAVHGRGIGEENLSLQARVAYFHHPGRFRQGFDIYNVSDQDLRATSSIIASTLRRHTLLIPLLAEIIPFDDA